MPLSKSLHSNHFQTTNWSSKRFQTQCLHKKPTCNIGENLLSTTHSHASMKFGKNKQYSIPNGFFICSYLYGSLKGICGFCSRESARRLDHKVDSFQNSTIEKKTMKSNNWNQIFLVYTFPLLLAHFFNIY